MFRISGLGSQALGFQFWVLAVAVEDFRLGNLQGFVIEVSIWVRRSGGVSSGAGVQMHVHAVSPGTFQLQIFK